MIAYKDFAARSRQIAANVTHRGFINRALGGYEIKRDENISRQVPELGRGAPGRRPMIKYEAVNHLEDYLKDFIAKARGATASKVHVGEPMRQSGARLHHCRSGEGKQGRAQDHQGEKP